VSQHADEAVAGLAYAETLTDFRKAEAAIEAAKVHALLDIAAALRGENA
jgi:hypothetical protein